MTAAVTDFSLYLIWVAIPYKAISLDATPAILGLLSATSALAYVLTTVFAGRLSDRVSRLLLARMGALVFAAGCLLILRAPSIAWMFPFLPLIGLGMGFYWPPIQAAVADEGRLAVLEKNIGLFNVFWSSGKALGFLVGGSLYARFGAGPIFVIASIVMLLMMVVIPRRRPEAVAEEEGGGEYASVGARDLRAFLHMAWLANAIAFGVGNTMNAQYPKLMLKIGFGSQPFGIYLFLIFIMQTLTFQLLRTLGGWRFRRFPVYAMQAAMGLAVFVVSFLTGFPLILLSAVPLGMGLGLAYHASITYSLASHTGRGGRAGIHECLLGTGNLLLPLVGGLLASATGDLRMPYWLCGAVVAGGLAGQEVLWRRTRSPASGPLAGPVRSVG